MYVLLKNFDVNKQIPVCRDVDKSAFVEVQKFMKRLNTILNCMMGSFFGVFIRDLVANYRNYLQFREIYDASNSAPWYYRSIPSLITFIIVVVICLVIKLIIHKKAK